MILTYSLRCPLGAGTSDGLWRELLFAHVVDADSLCPNTAFSAPELLQNFRAVVRVIVVDDDLDLRMTFCHRYRSPAEDRDLGEGLQSQHML